MNQLLIEIPLMVLVSITAMLLIVPFLIKYSTQLKLVDQPNHRKVHVKPIPAIGGLSIFLSFIVTSLFFSAIHEVMTKYTILFFTMFILMVTGVLDDRLNLSPKIRFLIQIISAFFIARSGIRIDSLCGIFGVHAIPDYLQYALTILVITGITNAFNLLDGIDGLLGFLSIVLLTVLGILSVINEMYLILVFILPLLSALIIFIKFNWKPAKIFLGDGGSLMLGYFMTVIAIHILSHSYEVHPQYINQFLTQITALFMLPVLDTLRVFHSRVRIGNSPFSADKNHLHHLFVKQHLTHNLAVKRIIGFQILLLITSFGLSFLLPVTILIILQAIVVIIYTFLLQTAHQFHLHYRMIKQLESR